MARLSAFALIVVLLATSAAAQEGHYDHPIPERLGSVHFPISCDPAVTAGFDRSVALLHSFAYEAADAGFADVAARDPACAMAHWGRAMTRYHQLWDAPAGAGLAAGISEAGIASSLPAVTQRERDFIAAIQTYYGDAEHLAPTVRALRYSDAMAAVAGAYPEDDEAQVFFGLSLVATASPADRAHARQKAAADILEQIWTRSPEHPGVPHYLIHAYDSAELAQRGLPAARAYSGIAPSVPHALHMPSHMFTRLGLWSDSINSNLAARAAAHAEGDVGEELHAMDYLTYAYLQLGQSDEAAQVVESISELGALRAEAFKVGYAGNAMPVRLAVETADWDAAAQLSPLPGSAPQVAAMVWWGRALGRLRGATRSDAVSDIAQLRACRDALNASGDAYWTRQVDALLKSAEGWSAAAQGEANLAVNSLVAAADEEDELEKLPLTPGPIVPAREQLGELFLALNQPREALDAFNAALALAPARRGALQGAAEARRRITDLAER